MASKTLTYYHDIAGVLTDLDAPPTLSDEAGTYGVRRADTQAVAVAAGAEFTRTTTGTYTYAISGLADGVRYQYSIRSVYGGEVDYDADDFLALADTPHRASRWDVVTPPVGWPVRYEDVEAHLRLTTADVAYVESLIAAATDYAEDRLATCLMPQTLVATFYDGEPLVLPRGPLIQVQAVTDRTDAPVTGYELTHVGKSARVVLTAPAQYPVSVRFGAGYASAEAVPAAVKLAILCRVGTLYENRESVTDRPRHAVPHSLDAFYGLKSRNVGVG